jgi:mono/diheme cytochrome c family protein
VTALIFALLLFPFAQAESGGASAAAGKSLWEDPGTRCKNCHGNEGEGGYGPDLAGRQLSAEQFRRAVRQPWGVMPAYTEQQISDEQLAHLAAYFGGLPRVAQLGKWRTPVPEGAPLGQQLLIATAGCGQCHGPVLGGPRQAAGGAAADFEWLRKMVYTHTTADPRFAKGRMGNFSTARLPVSALEEIWRYMSKELGLRANVRAELTSDTPATYKLAIENRGIPGKGFTAEDVTISLALPPGCTVTGTTGPGYQGVKPDSKTGGDTVVWTMPRIEPAAKLTYTVTLAGSGASTGIKSGAIRWGKPVLANGETDGIQIAAE